MYWVDVNMPDGSTRYFPGRCKCQDDREREQEQREAQERKRRRVKRFFTMAEFGENLKDASFKNWVHSQDTEAALREAADLIKNWDTRFKHRRGLLLYGRAGNGKSHLAVALSKEIAERTDLVVLYHNVNRLLLKMEKARFSRMESEEMVLDAIAGADVIIMDDIGLGRWGDTEVNNFESVVDILNGHKKMVIATLNLENPNDLEKMVGPRSSDRLCGLCKVVANNGWSYRRKTAKELQEQGM